MISLPRRSASRDDLGAGVPAAHESWDHRDAVRVTDRARLVELAVRALLLLGQLRAQRQVERDLEHRHGCDLRAALGREARGHVERVVGGAGPAARARASAGTRAPARDRRRAAPSPSRSSGRAPSGGGRRRSRARPTTIQPRPAQRVARSRARSRRTRSPVARPAEDREERPVDAADPQVRPGAVEQLLLAGRTHPQPHERGVRDRERERRPERVDRADEVDVARAGSPGSGRPRRRRRARATAS